MSAGQWLLLLPAGVGAGLTGSIAGLASLVSYPALLAAGLGPVSANVTNTVALVFSSAGSLAGSRGELRGQRPRLRRLLGPALLGGITGAALLLATPSDAFERVVPVLIALGSVAILLPRRALSSAPEHDRGWLPAATYTIAIYGGYFGAAAGVLLLALLLRGTGETLARTAAARNLLLGSANLVAAIGFAAFGPVRWAAAVPLGIGCLVGGRLGPVLVRHAPARLLRVGIALAGAGLAVALGVSAYS